MNLFHRHCWVETARAFTAPVNRKVEMEGGGYTVLAFERSMFGFTTIILRCSGCGDIKHTELLGKHLLGWKP